MENFTLERPKRGRHYVYFNANPKKLETSDCVIRALAVGLDKPWLKIYDDLTAYGRELGLMPNNNDCFIKYLEAHGAMPIQTIAKRKHLWRDAWAFARAHRRGRYILHMRNHVSVIVNGIFYDIWDCSDRCVFKAWFIEDSDKEDA